MKVQLDRGRAAEDADHHADLAAIRIDLVDRPDEVAERPVGHLHALADLERHLRRAPAPVSGAACPRIRLISVSLERHRVLLVPDEVRDARDVGHQVLRLLVHLHLDST